MKEHDHLQGSALSFCVQAKVLLSFQGHPKMLMQLSHLKAVYYAKHHQRISVAELPCM